MLDILLLDILQNLDISQYCRHPTTSFIFDRLGSLSLDFNTQEPYEGSIVCKTLNIGVRLALSLLLMNCPGLID